MILIFYYLLETAGGQGGRDNGGIFELIGGIIGGAIGGSACFSSNSFVIMTDFSVKEITELKRGDLVLSINSYGNIETTEVITLMDFGESFGNS